MSAVDALKAARAAGVELAIDGDDIALKAASAPPAAVLGALSRHKAQIVALLRPAEDGLSAEDWQVFFDERAGIIEFDGGLPRAEAEAQAFSCCVVEWLNRNPERSPAGRCLGCGDPEYAHNPLLPCGAEPAGRAWLHSRCWPAWYTARKAKAVSALAAMGISAPVGRSMKREEQSKHLPSYGPLVAFGVILERIPEPKAKPTRAKPALELSPFQPVERDLPRSPPTAN
jgi:hypothetical protein